MIYLILFVAGIIFEKLFSPLIDMITEYCGKPLL